MACNGVCARYKVTTVSYDLANNVKKCAKVCNCFIQWEGVHCPCCNFKLRTKARSSKYRHSHRMIWVRKQNSYKLDIFHRQLKQLIDMKPQLILVKTQSSRKRRH
jgi:hypothetical protein